MNSRHWPSAWTWLSTVLTVSSVAPVHAQELVVHPDELLADDVQAAARQQVVDVGDAAGDRVVDRDHGEPRLPSRTAAKASSNEWQGSGASSGKACRQAMCE